MNTGEHKIGQIVGINRAYITDGIWIRCDCGTEILEILQDCNVYGPTEYQFRFFGPIGGRGTIKLTDEDIYWACFTACKEEIIQVADFFALNISPDNEQKEIHLFIKNEKNKNVIHCVRNEEFGRGDIMLETPDGEKIIWDCVINDYDYPLIVGKLYEMLLREEGEE